MSHKLKMFGTTLRSRTYYRTKPAFVNTQQIRTHHQSKSAMKHRVIVPDMIDDPRLDGVFHELALVGHARLNGWSRLSFWPVLLDPVRQTTSGFTHSVTQLPTRAPLPATFHTVHATE